MSDLTQPGLIFTLAAYLTLIGVLVIVHEFGHYFVGRLCGVRALTFSIGFGRELLGWTDRHGTRWKVGAIPLGGYVRFLGDMNAASLPDHGASLTPSEQAEAFPFKPLWQRAAIVAAGPAINFLFAILLFTTLFSVIGRPVVPPVVQAVVPNSAAAAAGILPGDRFVEVADRSIESFERLASVVMAYPARPIPVRVERAGRLVDLTATPRREVRIDRFGNHHDVGFLGIQGGAVRVERANPLAALVDAVDHTIFITTETMRGIRDIVLGVRPITDLSGPVRIAKFSGEAAALGLLSFVEFVALVSIAIGFMNLLPIPVLDGGHLALYAVEAARGRPVSARAQELAFMAGFMALVSLFMVATWNDLTAVGLFQRIAGFLG